MTIANPALAVAPDASRILATPSVVTIDLDTATSATTVAKLDANCHNAVSNGQSYTIVSTSDTTTISVSPNPTTAMHCEGSTSKKPLPESATLTISVNAAAVCGLADFTRKVHLYPVAGPKGIQDKLDGPTDVTVNVLNTPDCTTDGPPPPPPPTGANPAAPALANAYLNNDDTDLLAACQNKNNVSYTGKGWRGAVISAVAAWMPTPESIKDHDGVAAGWTAYVDTEVNHICGYHGTEAPVPVSTVDGDPALPGYTAYPS